MPTGSIGISSSSVVGNTTFFNTEVSGDIVSQTTYSKITDLQIETFQTEESKSFFATLQELNFLSASTSESVISLFKFDSTSGGILWHKKIGSTAFGGIISEYFSDSSNERLFVHKYGTGLIALNPDSGAAVHSISVLSPTSSSVSVVSIKAKQIDSSSVEVYIVGNYTNASSGQEGFVSKLTYNFSTGFTLNWTIALSGPPTAVDEVCQVESIAIGYGTYPYVFCGGYVKTATNTYRPFVIALNKSNGTTAWERIFSTYDNTSILPINNILLDNSDLDNPKILCAGTLYSTNSTYATPTVFTLLQATGLTSLSRCVAPASGLSGYAGMTIVRPYYADVTVPGSEYFVLSGPSIGTTSTNSTPGFFQLYSSSFGGISLDIGNAYRFTNPQYTPGGPAGIDSGYPTVYFEAGKSGNAYLSSGSVYKQLGTPIFGQSSQAVGYIIKTGNIGAIPKTYTFRNSGAQAVLQSATVTWQATGSSFTNSAAGSNLNQAAVTFSISTITPTIIDYTPSNKSFIKTKLLETPGPGPVLG